MKVTLKTNGAQFPNHTQKPGKVFFEVLKLLLGKELSVGARNRRNFNPVITVRQTITAILDYYSEVLFFTSLLVGEASCNRFLIKVQTL